MKERNVKHERRLKKLGLSCLLLAVVLVVGTYAWFIGMTQVNVSSFEIEIASIDGLELSLDGINWYDGSAADKKIKISSDAIGKKSSDEGYIAHFSEKTSWTELKPVSSVGHVDPTTSKLVMYDKGSLTAATSGYRLMAARVENTLDKEEDGYIAFDLFIKNKSGDEYYSDVDIRNEEAIYLSRESEVKIVTSGEEKDFGIQNSARIAFAQIGRVKASDYGELKAADADKLSTLRGIACTDQISDGVSTICDDRLAAIYEPNDTAHVDGAINWVAATCKNSEGEACVLARNTAYPTYAVAGEINIYGNNFVNVYDGFNGNMTHVYVDKSNDKDDDFITEFNQDTEDAYANKLFAVDTFTDTEKDVVGVERKPIFYLAPNSITKVRVYIYIEGQDIDNYDFASQGKKINAVFGFSKEKFVDESEVKKNES